MMSTPAAPLEIRRALADEFAELLELDADDLIKTGQPAEQTRACARRLRAAGRWPIPPAPSKTVPAEPEKTVLLAALVAGALAGLDTTAPIEAVERRELLMDSLDLRMLRVLDTARRELSVMLRGGENVEG